MMRTILIVDDDPLARLHLERFLKREGHAVLVAFDGQQGVEMFQAKSPDLVLMDVMMPVMNGHEATRRIRAVTLGADVQTPVIFLTGVEDQAMLAECLHCGGDDFISKPFNHVILQARLNAWLRRVELAEKIAQDREAIENVILKMRKDSRFDPFGMRYLMTSVDKTTGDLVLSARDEAGVQYVLLGDFTGHGLVAAVCGPLVSDIFHSLAVRGFSSIDMLRRINEKIHDRLPVDMFLTASFIALDRQAGRMRVFNAGMHPLFIYRQGQGIVGPPSRLMPFGIMREISLEQAEETVEVCPGDLIYLYSDGVYETQSPEGDFFGGERLHRALSRIAADSAFLETIHEDLDRFRGDNCQRDDITLVELTV
ncbi:MAG: fused response regulator/phosphatase [Magnetococcales bacterium]|nr:fused response regulator/phosphatase [Magnetococcales bacterium]